MAPLGSGSKNDKGGLRRSGDDAVALTISYVKQETLGALKGIGKFMLWGVAGSLVIALGVLFGLLGLLRLLQDETGTALTGDWSWVPYFAVSVVGLGIAGVAAWRITAGPAERKVPTLEAARAQAAVPHAAVAVTTPAATPTIVTQEG
jgi:hypothetical protein